MKTYKVVMVNSHTGFKTAFIVQALSFSEAGSAACEQYGPDGYDLIESIIGIA